MGFSGVRSPSSAPAIGLGNRKILIKSWSGRFDSCFSDMDNRTIKYNEEIPLWDTLSDEEFLAEAESWVTMANSRAEHGHSLVFVGRKGIERLVNIARKNYDHI